MHKQRLEAFSDGVIAIIITIMVLELKVPHGEAIKDLLPLIPIFVGYVLSFIFVAIYWNNHHHLLQAPSTPLFRTMLFRHLHRTSLTRSLMLKIKVSCVPLIRSTSSRTGLPNLMKSMN